MNPFNMISFLATSGQPLGLWNIDWKLVGLNPDITTVGSEKGHYPSTVQLNCKSFEIKVQASSHSRAPFLWKDGKCVTGHCDSSPEVTSE